MLEIAIVKILNILLCQLSYTIMSQEYSSKMTEKLNSKQ